MGFWRLENAQLVGTARHPQAQGKPAAPHPCARLPDAPYVYGRHARTLRSLMEPAVPPPFAISDVLLPCPHL